MKLKLIFCVLAFGLFISACTLLVKPECRSENDCLEIYCPDGTFAHEMCVEGKCKFLQGCPKLNCSAEGEIIPWEISKECCAGLHKIMQNIDSRSAGSVCTVQECGDGNCIEPEGEINCPDDCKEKAETPLQRFCGWETNASCTYTSDCMAGGCSGQVCGGKNEEMITTCEYTDCYNAAKYNASCACVMGKCSWVIKA